MHTGHDIATLDDIKLLVDTFYDRVRQNELIGPIFNNRIEDRWPHHLEKLYRFWQTILLDAYTYNGAPFPPHATMPIDARHFQTWLSIFKQTVYDLFTGAKADEAVWRAGKMALVFQTKLEYMRTHGTKPLV